MPVYNVTFFDHIYRLLRAQCVYCHRLQMSRADVNLYTCKLRLLQYGLTEEVAEVELIGSKKGAKSGPKKDKGDDSDDEEDDDETIMEKRIAYVNRSISEAKKDGRLEGLMTGAKNPIAAEQRRDLVKSFLKDINGNRKCYNCSWYVPNNATLLRCSVSNLYCDTELLLPIGRTVTTRFSGRLCLKSPSLPCSPAASRPPTP